MTPFLRSIFERAVTIKPKSKELRDKAVIQMQETVCFEMTAVMDLVGQTIETLNGSTIKAHDGRPVVGHGGLLVPPSQYTWFEWQQENTSDEPDVDFDIMKDVLIVTINERPKKYRMGAMVSYDEDSQKLHIDIMSDLDATVVMTSHVEMYDDETCRICCYKSENDSDEHLAKVAGYIGAHVVAMILIINAPYGIKTEAQPVHKAHARQARGLGFELKPHHYITLNKTAPPPKYSGHNPNGPAFHKAFHFVRSHLRHFQKGGTTLVKAHWRGDPRLGICPMPDYKVKP